MMIIQGYKFLLGLLLISLLLACTSAPVKNQTGTISGSQRPETLNALFSYAKSLFLSKQYGPAAAALLPLANQGHVDAQYTIGYMYHYGYGVPRNEKKSVHWIATAASRGHPQAKAALARINSSHDERGVVSIPAGQP